MFELALFQFTLLVLLASIFTSAVCFSAYQVSRTRVMLLLCAGFLFYFFDTAWVFQDEFVIAGLGGVDANAGYLTVRSIASIVVGGGALQAFWLAFRDRLGVKGRAGAWLPLAAFVVVSAALLAGIPQSDPQRFVFYAPRSAFLLYMIGFAAVRFARCDAAERQRLARYIPLCALLLVLDAGVVAYDAVRFLGPGAPTLEGGWSSLATERNYAENVLMLCAMFFASRLAIKTLALRFERPPANPDERQTAFIGDNLALYGKRYGLSERECDVLRLVLEGKDNRCIASELYLALSTVKVHVHNILRKTGQANRQDLVRDFWRNQ